MTFQIVRAALFCFVTALLGGTVSGRADVKSRSVGEANTVALSHLQAGKLYRRAYRRLKLEDHGPVQAVLNEQRLNGVHFILVGGFAGELLDGSYLVPMQTHLSLLGAGSVAIIQPPSHRSVEQNSEKLLSRIQEIVSAVRKLNPDAKVVLLGHSKGGVEVQDLVLSHPEILLGTKRAPRWVDLVVTLQSPLCDCDLANGLSSPLDRLSAAPAGVGKWLASFGQGVTSLNFSSSQARRSQRIEALLYQPKGKWILEQLRRRTVHLASFAKVQQMPSSVVLFEWIRRTAASRAALEKQDFPSSLEPSDGIIATRHMQNPELGFAAQPLEGVDHITPFIDPSSLFAKALAVRAHRLAPVEWMHNALALGSWLVPERITDRNLFLQELGRVQLAMALTLAQVSVDHLQWVDGSLGQASNGFRRLSGAVSCRSAF